jgi:hypothetical protein
MLVARKYEPLAPFFNVIFVIICLILEVEFFGAGSALTRKQGQEQDGGDNKNCYRRLSTTLVLAEHTYVVQNSVAVLW